MPRKPESHAIVTELGPPIFAAAGRHASEPRLSGHGSTWSDDEQRLVITNVKVWSRAGRGQREVGITTATRRLPTWVYLHQVLGGDVTRSERPRFPVVSTVSRERVRIPVDGRARVFTAYLCGNRACAVATIDRRHVSVLCDTTALGDLELARLDDRAIAALARQAERDERRMQRRARG